MPVVPVMLDGGPTREQSGIAAFMQSASKLPKPIFAIVSAPLKMGCESDDDSGAQVEICPCERLVGNSIGITNGRQAKGIRWRATAYVQVRIRRADSGEAWRGT